MPEVLQPMSPGSRSLASSARSARSLPSGTVTLLFTDIEGSTRHLHDVGADRYAAALAEHRKIVRRRCAQAGGVEVDTQGDALFVAFPDATRAVAAAGAIAEKLGEGPMRVRIGLHTGRPLLGEEGYVGEDVHLGARIAAAGHGGQVLMSQATREAAGEPSPLTELGEHRLKDIPHPVVIYQLGVESFPPLKTISNTNLPRPADTFVGREAEVAHVVARVHERDRLLTLAGPGGTGKTRLALEAGATLVSDFKAGVFWVDLTPVRDPDAVAAAVAATLTPDAEGSLEEHIGEREMLLVLDNLEHVIAAASWVGSLVRACPNLSVLVTSRERMRVRGESFIDVPPMESAESSRLFTDRSGLVLSAEIEELCARLDHLPLAIELAAARTSSLTPRQILERLGERLDILKGGRDADPRQRTLRGAIDWSHSLLDFDERQLFRRLAAFVGGATLEAIEAVCESDLDATASLVDKSLVRFDGRRYTMLEMVREYAAEQLAASDDNRVFPARHAAWVLDLVATRAPELRTGVDEELGPALTAELGNIQAAFAWFVAADDPSGAAALIEAAWWFIGQYLSQGGLGLAMCRKVLAMPGLSDADRAAVRHREGNFAAGDTDHSRDAWVDAAAIANRIGDSQREGHLLRNLAVIESDPVAAARLVERAIELLPDDDRELRWSQWILVGCKAWMGDIAGADALALEVYEWAKGVEDYDLISQAELVLAEAALRGGNPSEALERATRSRDLGVRRGHAVGTVLGENVRCRAAVRLYQFTLARTALAETMDLIRQGDLEAEPEIAHDVLLAATELLAATGDIGRASELDAVRAVLSRQLQPIPAIEKLHDAWLAANGVTPPRATEALGVPAALAMVRQSLKD